MTVPTPEQLDHLIGHADHRPLTPVEAAALRAGVADMRRKVAAAAEVAARRLARARRAETRVSELERAITAVRRLAALTGRLDPHRHSDYLMGAKNAFARAIRTIDRTTRETQR